MKKLLSVLLVVLMLVLLWACCFSEVEHRSGKNNSSDKVSQTETDGLSDVVIQTETADPTDIPGVDGNESTPITAIPDFLAGEWENSETGVAVKVNEISANKKSAKVILKTVDLDYALEGALPYSYELECTLVNGKLEFFSEYKSLSGKFTVDTENETLTLLADEWKSESELEGKEIVLSKVETAYDSLSDIPYGDYDCQSLYSDSYLRLLVCGRGENSLSVNLWNHTGQALTFELELIENDNGIVFESEGYYSVSGKAFTTSNGIALAFEEGIKVGDVSIARGICYFRLVTHSVPKKNTTDTIEDYYAGYWASFSSPIVSVYLAVKGYGTVDGSIMLWKGEDVGYVDIPFLFGETNGNVITITDTDGNEIGGMELVWLRRYNYSSHYYERCIIITLDTGEPGAPNIIERLLVMSAKG